ncbi:hypothetical protein N7495_007536 [Penicillium taxi]|uniref:uncharacterized protein n=1 Tax=Penicillium taxi TaxID=168475 RepID=UPI00254584F0|nr:uncharacterized protein N7495_007536 [Penicillium taxi]KAJ5887495.1 hypothetical protein N7495_007536 [Penicillium taxi]
MAKDKDRDMNPAAAQRKQDKQKALKKGKAEALARRNEKLGQQNPERLKRQINDYKSLEESGKKLQGRDKELKEALERELKAVLKARELLGDKAPTFPKWRDYSGPKREDRPRREGGDVLGKRRRDDSESETSELEDGVKFLTEEEALLIPMPQDSPPPDTPEYIQRLKRSKEDRKPAAGRHQPPPKPVIESKLVYEAKPQLRDLRQEAIDAFMPSSVRANLDAMKGRGDLLLEPEEVDKLEKAGYGADAAEKKTGPQTDQSPVTADRTLGDEERSLAELERQFNEELKQVQIEEVTDEDA